MRCDKCKREMRDDEPAWRLWRSFALCADCRPDAYFCEPQRCARCGRPVHEHDTISASSTAARAVRSCYFRRPEPCAQSGEVSPRHTVGARTLELRWKVHIAP